RPRMPLPMRRLPALLCSLFALAACATREFEEAEASDPDFPNAALQWRAERDQDEHGSIPPGAWQQALQARAPVVASTGAVDDGGNAPAGWVEPGPFNVPGRSRTIAIDPRDTRVLWSGGVSGGLWKSVDRGATWSIVDDWWTNLSIGSLTLDPGNPDVM